MIFATNVNVNDCLHEPKFRNVCRVGKLPLKHQPANRRTRAAGHVHPEKYPSGRGPGGESGILG
eukprot:483580-Heterocapsa_arctica.AAC.1